MTQTTATNQQRQPATPPHRASHVWRRVRLCAYRAVPMICAPDAWRRNPHLGAEYEDGCFTVMLWRWQWCWNLWGDVGSGPGDEPPWKVILRKLRHLGLTRLFVDTERGEGKSSVETATRCREVLTKCCDQSIAKFNPPTDVVWYDYKSKPFTVSDLPVWAHYPGESVARYVDFMGNLMVHWTHAPKKVAPTIPPSLNEQV